jgi:hypothetical protein
MVKSNSSLVIAIVMTLCGCITSAKGSDDNIITITPQYTSQQLDSIKRLFVENGDENAYVEYFGYRSDDHELLYSFYMADTYNSAVAQYRIYRMLTEFYNNLGVEIDTVTNALAISYLKKSVEQNDSYAQFEMSRLLLYGIGVPQDTVAAKEYIYKIFEKPKADKVWFIKRRDYLKSLQKQTK